MLMGRNIVRRFAATLVAGGLTLAPSGVWGQPQPPGGALNQPAFDPAPPPPAAVLDMFNAVCDWVQAWRTPMDPVGSAPRIAAAVTLRFDGAVVGRGVAISPDQGGSAGILMMATARAISEASMRLPVARDALREENLKVAAKQIAVTLEVGGPTVPIAIVEYADAINEVAPGLDGVAVKMGDKFEAMFPELMLTTGTDAAAAYRALVSKVSGDPTLGLKKPGELRAEMGVVFYRFRAAQITQTNPGGSPVFLHRGGRIVQMREMDLAGLRSWADELAGHLVRGRSSASRFLEVTPNDVVTADDRQAALAAFALVRYSEMAGTTSAPGMAARGAADAALRTMAEFASDASGPASEALTWAALKGLSADSLEPGDPLRKRFEQCDVALQKSLESGLPSTTQESGIWVWALALRQIQMNPTIEGLVRRQFRETPAGSLASIMPWTGWAELLCARSDAGREIPSAPALRGMRTELWQHQLKGEDLPGEALDMAGGIVFTTTRQPLPTWQAARPLAFIATMLGDPALTEEKEVPGELARLLASLRFLRQLTADEPESHMFKDAGRARGGVRASLFDQRMPPEATALTLLAVCETIRSLDEIRARRAAVEGPPGTR
jgi:hypothetical protein